jgi:AAA ATPase domain/AAA domain
MSDPRKELQGKFTPLNQYANFGPSLKTLRIKGFRGIVDLTIDFQHPITAISGLNGAGKSTVGQLCLGGYKKPSTFIGAKRFFVRDFFPASAADPNPFDQNSSVVYTYNTNDPTSPQTLTVARATTQWSGYKRQPERACYYIGFTIYIPKVEQRDRSVYSAAQLTLTKQRPIADSVRAHVGRILGQPYDALHFQGITHGVKLGELGIASRFGAQYSENNMGFGEGRTLYLVDLLENSPEQSMFVIEEPETSLHENAHFELGKYLLDVCNRRHHQIILTTHSSALLQSMPAESRLLLLRDSDGVASFPMLSATRARSILSDGKHRELCILVEDEFAKVLLTEMIRQVDRELLKCLSIHEIGDTKAVRTAALLMRRLQRPCIAVRDADVGQDPANSLFSFPGTKPPEMEVLLNTDVQVLIYSEFGVDVPRVLTLNDTEDHHKFFQLLASEACTSLEYLRTLAIKRYLESIGTQAYQPLVLEIQKLEHSPANSVRSHLKR